ncbi:Na+/H+ antiporter NhaC family protein [Dethiosulfovibrio salsuginis]|uniref:Transporter, NhaC family n=1 Tax=Dethiosulfovibrio salsuginis TaxID=561720 RepID=A0A1X7JV93_9BACT|nr:Na+/H+ antiporter NhaC family protein [Dethiosulfovibrio salsuginis]SMG32127.1 transporter, NhaC family [Dethiosulfovibrio salsuginis]
MRPPSTLEAFAPLGLMLAFLGAQIALTGDFRPHMALVLAVAAGTISGLSRGYSWSVISGGMFQAWASGLPVLSIFVFLGVLVASWTLSGTVPFLVKLGLGAIVPDLFLPVAFAVSALTGILLGSGISTVGTVGIALAGVGKGLGIPLWLTAGAVVSGAFMGNRTSPISDTSILAPQMSEVDRRAHIRVMARSALVPFAFSLVLYYIVGLFVPLALTDPEESYGVIRSLESCFNLSPVALLPVAVVLALVLSGIEPLPGFFLSSLSAVVVAYLYQGWDLNIILSVLMDGGNFSTGSIVADGIVNRGGLGSVSMLFMMVSMALCMGGVLETVGSMERILKSIVSLKGVLPLGCLALLTTMLVSSGSGSGSVGIVVSGRMFNGVYRDLQVDRLWLSRYLVEGSILIVPLVPWAACGAFVASAMGLSSSDGSMFMYIPFSFFCLISPLWALLSPKIDV